MQYNPDYIALSQAYRVLETVCLKRVRSDSCKGCPLHWGTEIDMGEDDATVTVCVKEALGDCLDAIDAKPDPKRKYSDRKGLDKYPPTVMHKDPPNPTSPSLVDLLRRAQAAAGYSSGKLRPDEPCY